MRSMTGYGRGEEATGAGRVVVELRAVNHRFTEIGVRLPRSLAGLEDRLKRLVGTEVGRGRVDVLVSLEEYAGRQATVEVNQALASAYHQALLEIKRLLDLPDEPRLADLVALPEVVLVRDAEAEVETWWPAVEGAARQALGQLVAMREAEGAAIWQDLAHRIGNLEQIIKAIEVRAPAVVEAYHRRLGERVEELLRGAGHPGAAAIDGTRLATEVALFAERANVTEELVRAESHLEQLRKCEAMAEPVGRRLDFIVQELNREFNTVGAKANDAEISRLVVEAKAELEKVREQIQNLE